MPANPTDTEPPAIEAIPKKAVGLLGIILITAYLVISSTVLFSGLLVVWPVARSDAAAKVPPEATAAMPAVVTHHSGPDIGTGLTSVHFRVDGLLQGEVRLLVIMILAGALGGLIHALRSVFWYVGNRDLVWSWVVMYLLLPFVGAALAVLFYFVIRGGFFAPQAQFDQASPFGFAALAGLVGLFSEQAILKLKQVAEVIFVQANTGKDHQAPQKQARQD